MIIAIINSSTISGVRWIQLHHLLLRKYTSTQFSDPFNN